MLHEEETAKLEAKTRDNLLLSPPPFPSCSSTSPLPGDGRRGQVPAEQHLDPLEHRVGLGRVRRVRRRDLEQRGNRHRVCRDEVADVRRGSLRDEDDADVLAGSRVLEEGGLDLRDGCLC